MLNLGLILPQRCAECRTSLAPSVWTGATFSCSHIVAGGSCHPRPGYSSVSNPALSTNLGSFPGEGCAGDESAGDVAADTLGQGQELCFGAPAPGPNLPALNCFC